MSSRLNRLAGFVRFSALIALLVLVAAGCDFRWKRGDWGHRGDASLYGRVITDPDGFPLMEAEVRLSGPVERRTNTSRDGAFTLSGLPQGRYTVSLKALHGEYTTSVWLNGAESLTWPVDPPGFDRELFHQLSGLKKYYVDGSGRLTWEYGRLVRWEQRAIRVYLDTAGAPYEFRPEWADLYWHELTSWEGMLKGRVDFVRVYDARDAEIAVYWRPSGFLGDQAGIVRHLAFYENGALKRVQIEIDVEYGGTPGLWAHELAHAMGVDHVTDPRSVMYPWLQPGQRGALSENERYHVRLMYDIPSGRRLSSGYMSLLALPAGEAGSGGTLEDDAATGYRGHVTLRDGRHEEVDDVTARRSLGGAVR